MTAPKEKSNEIRIIRVYDAPVAAVWDAWTDPQQVGKWWGPRGFTLTTKSKDLRVGGTWVYTMHGPDGTDYPNYTTYHEVEKHTKLVYDHGAAAADKAPMFRVTVLFSEKGGKTMMDMTMALATAEAAEQTRKFIKKAGGNATWDRLGEHLAKAEGKEVFVINRTFEAPLDAMFQMWTDPKHIAQWMPPTGMTMRFISADLKEGGGSYYEMEAENKSMKLFGKAHYIKVQKPDTIVYTQQFADEKGDVSRHPMAPLWPETMLTTVKLTAEGPERTRVTVTWEVHGKATPEEVAAFVKEKPGMTQGWTGSFDKLESHLLAR